MRAHLLRLSVEAGHRGARKLDPVDQAMMQIAVQSFVVEQLTPAQRWTWLADGLMTARPSEFFSGLRRCDGLMRLLPEVEALFGVPQLSDARAPVDVGAHQLRLLDTLAAVSAPLLVRFAAPHRRGKMDVEFQLIFRERRRRGIDVRDLRRYGGAGIGDGHLDGQRFCRNAVRRFARLTFR